MKNIVALLLLLSILLTGIAVSFVTGTFAVRSLELNIEDSIANLHQRLQPRFAAFDSLIEREQEQLTRELETKLPEIAAEIQRGGLPFQQVPLGALQEMAIRYQVDELYLIDRGGTIVSTTFRPDLNFNLMTISEAMAHRLRGMYGTGKVFTDRMTLSTQTGILNAYAYYSPPGSDYIVETSINIRHFIRRARSQAYLEFLFYGFFLEPIRSNASVLELDLFMFNDLAAWSFTREGQTLDHAIRDQLREREEIRVQEGDRLTVYSRFTPTMTEGFFTQELCSKTTYDISELDNIPRRIAFFSLLALLVIIPLVYWIATRVLQLRIISPLEQVLHTLERVGEGDYATELSHPQSSVNEVQRISLATNRMQQEIHQRQQDLIEYQNTLEQRIAERTQELIQAKQQAELLARTDPLTGLNNRRAFFELGERALLQAIRYQRPLSLLLLDIDHFKQINDQWGHPTGDLALQQVSRVILDSLRQVDIPARLGGEEFAVLLPETGHHEALKLAERMRGNIEEKAFSVADDRHSITASFGLCTHQEGLISLEKLLQVADLALYQAKAGGRNQVIQLRPDQRP
jgi:diguanylate cyclase (GGDEF)-like protein